VRPDNRLLRGVDLKQLELPIEAAARNMCRVGELAIENRRRVRVLDLSQVSVGQAN